MTPTEVSSPTSMQCEISSVERYGAELDLIQLVYRELFRMIGWIHMVETRRLLVALTIK
jgi:hypothetical protein